MNNYDTLASLMTGLGIAGVDKSKSLSYVPVTLTDDQIITSYRQAWLAKKIIDIPAFDSVRKWRDWQAEADEITLIEAEEKRLNLRKKVMECMIKARLWGGACIYIGDGGPSEKEFKPSSIGKGGLQYLTVLSRRDVAAGELETDVSSEFYDKPKMYQISGAGSFINVHPSRLVIQIGNEIHDNLIGGNNNWGDSVLQSTLDAIKNVDSTAANIANLVFEAKIDVFKVPELMERISTDDYRKKLIERFNLANLNKSINHGLIMDGDEEFQQKTINFSTLPEILQQFLQIVSAASDIPITRLLGQSPGGLNSTGEGDMRNYHDRISSMQELEIGPAMYRLDEALIRSALGSRPPEIYYRWSPLEQMNEKEKAEIGKLKAEAANILIQTGMFSSEELRDPVANQMVEDGFYPGLETSLNSEPNLDEV